MNAYLLRYPLVVISIPLLASFVVTTVLVAIAIRLCHTHGWVAKPRSDRWHKSTPAFFGGVPIWAGFVATALAVLPFSNHLIWKLIAIGTLIFILGVCDDIFHLRPGPKLLIQTVAAALVLSCGVVYSLRESMAVNEVLSLIWIVGITNAFNLLDNMDGLSGGVALISAIYLLLFFVGREPQACGLLMALLAGAVGGFLLFNFYPAKIFMGDGGSLFLGFMLGTMSLMGITHVSGVPALVFAPITVLAVPLLDTIFVSITRRLRGQPVSVGGTDHCSHRLVRLGLRERDAVLLLYGLTAASGAIALALRRLLYPQAVGLISVWYLFLALFGINLFRTQVSGSNVHSPQSTRPRLWSRLLSQETLAFLLDPVVLSISYCLGYFLWFKSSVLPEELQMFLRSWPLVISVKFIVLYSSRVYRRSWWRGSVSDIYTLGRAMAIGEVLSVVALLAFYRLAGFSRLVFLLDFVFSWGLLLLLRQSATLFRESMAQLSTLHKSQSVVLVLGTSEHAEVAIKFLRDQGSHCAGLIDLNGGADLGRRVWGVQVVGHWDDLLKLVARYRATKIIVPDNEPMPCSEQEFLSLCRRGNVDVLKLGLYSPGSMPQAT